MPFSTLWSMSRTRWWVLLLCLSVVLFVLDDITPPLVEFTTTLIIPVLLATWFLGFLPGLGFAILLAFIRLVMEFLEPTFTPIVGSVNTGIHLLVFIVTAVLVRRINMQRIRIKALEGILPICMHCKKISNPDGTWQQLESYISTHSEAMFSHGICEACERKHYPE
jgi:K+-sensing histidine kinase KdpD